MKHIWNSFKIAFAMYSKIPMPHADWTEENMRCVMCFFPLIGVVTGTLFIGWQTVSSWLISQGIALTSFFVAAVFALIPLVVTGGIHLDGMMDTADGLASWQDSEKRLEILKDSHAGAFAILSCVSFFLFYTATMTQIDNHSVIIIALGFVLSRTLSAMAVVTFPLAKNTGLAATFSDGARKKTVRAWMVVFLVLLSVTLLWYDIVLGAAALGSSAVMYLVYYHMAMKNFGGITGDLAGWFLQNDELIIAVSVTVVELTIRSM